jgi:hypothetical protein
LADFAAPHKARNIPLIHDNFLYLVISPNLSKIGNTAVSKRRIDTQMLMYAKPDTVDPLKHDSLALPRLNGTVTIGQGRSDRVSKDTDIDIEHLY